MMWKQWTLFNLLFLQQAAKAHKSLPVNESSTFLRTFAFIKNQMFHLFTILSLCLFLLSPLPYSAAGMPLKYWPESICIWKRVSTLRILALSFFRE